MTQWWGTRVGSGELLSFRGKVLVHDNPGEIEWLIIGCRTVPLVGKTTEEVGAKLGRQVMLWKNHPGMTAVQWPIQKEAFL